MTTNLSFIRIPLCIDRLWKLAAERKWWPERSNLMDEGLALHHALSEVFGPGVIQPFRLMVAPRHSQGFIYAYSSRPVDEIKSNAVLCGPEYDKVFNLHELEAKTMPTTFSKGRRLGFNVRLRPVRRSRAHADKGSEREIDVFLHELLSRFPDLPPNHAENFEGGMAANRRTREAVYTDWLAEKLGYAAAILDKSECKLTHFRRSKVVRNSTITEGPDATLQGILTVGEPDRFAELLRKGIGRHKAYGYGMLLLRPAR